MDGVDSIPNAPGRVLCDTQSRESMIVHAVACQRLHCWLLVGPAHDEHLESASDDTVLMVSVPPLPFGIPTSG